MWSWSDLEGLVPHVFLPRKLPESTDYHDLIILESFLLNLMTETLEKFSNDDGEVGFKIDRTVQLFKTWVEVQGDTGFEISQAKQAIQSLESGHSIAFYIRAQNAGLMLSIPNESDISKQPSSENNLIIAAFPASLKSAVVMNSEQSNQTLACSFPTIALQVPRISPSHTPTNVAHQLEALYSKQCGIAMPKSSKAGKITIEVRDVPDPMLITKWLTATLSNAESEGCTKEDFPIVIKKMRNAIIWLNALLPFRRSGMYMTAKVVMSISLIQEFGEVRGKFLYKLIMIQFMTTFCQVCNNLDLGIQIMAKISRRMHKLYKYFEENSEVLTGQRFMKKYDEIRQASADVLTKTRTRLEDEWNQIVHVDSRRFRFNFVNSWLDFKRSDTIHLLSHSRSIFESSKSGESSALPFTVGSLCPVRHLSAHSFPEMDLVTGDEVACGILLRDIEEWVQHHFENMRTLDYSSHATSTRKLFMHYFGAGKEYYKNDPVGYSRLVITCLKIIQVFDEIGVRRYQLLKVHRPGIPTKCIPNLLLLTQESLELAQFLENYFIGRESNARDPSLIEQSVANASSFAVKFAREDHEMRLLQQKIVAFGEEQIESKLKELSSKREEHRILLERISLLSCTYFTRNYQSYHDYSCHKCSLKAQAENITAEPYEKPLPENENRQLAVVFELLIPAEIACLRDIIFVFASEVGVQNVEQGNSQSIFLWTDYFQICAYKALIQPISVHLVSTVKSYRDSHYGKKLHVTCSDSEFIIENAYNVKYGTNNELLESSYGKPLKKPCTLKVELGTPYSNLQWMIDSTNHTQNQVLAHQVDCHQKLDLKEFKMFGTLRAGHRVQLRNIYSALAQGNLTFKSESVFALISQSLWEAGPPGAQSNGLHRDSHQDFKDSSFTNEFLKLLSSELEANSKNWNQPLVLLSLIVIACRILNLSKDSSIQGIAVSFLKDCRRVANSWVERIKQLLSGMTQYPIEEVAKIRIKLIECATCSALTFSVDPARIALVLQNDADIAGWLQAVAWIDENVLINFKYAGQTLRTPLKNLLRMVRATGLSLVNRLHQLIRSTNGSSLTTFVKKHWVSASSKNNSKWQSLESPRGQIYFSKWSEDGYSTLTVEIDIVLGTFLVDGAPLGRLPQSITNHQGFARVFGSSIFEVRTEGPGTYVTITKTMGAFYKFFIGQENRLFITEIRENGEQFHLIPHDYFGGDTLESARDIPLLLIQNTSHWWNKKTQIVHFRPQLFSDKSFQDDAKVKYQLDITSKLLKEISTGKTFVDINKASFGRIANIMKRLEHPTFVHLMYHESTETTTIELPRMGLNFEIEKNTNRIVSKEFRGMRIAKDQKFRTLVGLGNGLLLESQSFEDSSQLLLVPHGEIVISSDKSDSHQRVTISNATLSKPPYFSYDVDERLRQLKAGQSHLGWLYLAHLHAKTASPLPDPFTGLTGTEAALKLLQSALCWSCEPIVGEARHILGEISAISPGRTYYPAHLKCMQSVKWPAGLCSMAADEAFILVVNKLITESERLGFLFQGGAQKNQVREPGNPLTRRAYYRNSAYVGSESKVSSDFDQSLNNPVISKDGRCFDANFEEENMKGVRQLAELGHTWTNARPNAAITAKHLTELLLTSYDEVQGVSPAGIDPNSVVTDWLLFNFRDSWLNLYNFARKLGNDVSLKSTWKMLLCLLAFNGESVEHLLILQTIALHPSKFDDPPSYGSYETTAQHDFQYTTVKNLFKAEGADIDTYMASCSYKRRNYNSDYEFRNAMESELRREIEQQTEKLTDVVARNWPIECCHQYLFSGISYSQINLPTALKQINKELLKWFRNYKLRIFLDKVATTIVGLAPQFGQNEGLPTVRVYEVDGGSQFSDYLRKKRSTFTFADFIQPIVGCSDNARNVEAARIFRSGQFDIQLENSLSNTKQSVKSSPVPFPFQNDTTCPVKNFYNRSTQESWDAYQNELSNDTILSRFPSTVELNSLRLFYKEKAESLKTEVEHCIYREGLSPEMQALFVGGLFPRLTPGVILPFICQPTAQVCRNNERHDRLYNLIGALCVVWTLEQRIIRCIRYSKADGMELALKRELMNPGHQNWRPEWLLLELEMDMMIRPVQIQVTEKMLNPPDDKNALMQLNMGEGKTAVIIPLLAVAIADGKQLCRVTVLRSLHQTNMKRLILTLGGLLNRRIYNFPCRRDMKIGSSEAAVMLDLHKECMYKRGVVLTRPEHRHSLQLKGYEKARASQFPDARSLFDLQQWLKKNCRDVLDESDEILHVKYQLIYTVGDQLPIDGASLRWTIAEDVLQRLQSHIPIILKEFGDNSVEYRCRSTNPQEFPLIRLLKTLPYKRICQLIATDFVDGRARQTPFQPIPFHLKQMVLDFMTSPSTVTNQHDEVLRHFPEGHTGRDVLLILRGILACGVLELALSKRWKVNYGVDPNGLRLMAVPFRAKDVAMEKTEFGHPDVAILFTQLSYYYSGLNESQIDQCFDYLDRCENPQQEYERWITGNLEVHASISQLSGVNLMDPEQKIRYLYPALKMNTKVVDFFLGNAVFPRESKQFYGKMVCTAWDLCVETNAHPTTGFSGTNDTALLLPLSILQNDLPELQGTNGQVLYYLLKPENNNYSVTSKGSSCKDILRLVVQTKCRVLLDVGALILESNIEVAEQWLKLLSTETVDAIIYFDSRDNLIVQNRNNVCNSFETSFYRERLDRCAIYLDDIHTRGTDLKFPSGFKACVTLGTGVTKDKLVQGCMRMRMLGQGHTIHFLASPEVNNSIRALAREVGDISAQDVLQWAMTNTCAFTRDKMMYWAAAGVNFAQKHSAETIFDLRTEDNFEESALALSDQCTDKEIIDLLSIYGGFRREEFIPDVVEYLKQKSFEQLQSKLINGITDLAIATGIYTRIGGQVLRKCRKYAPKVTVFAQLLEEEQERELEQELEEERQISRPGPANASPHVLDPLVQAFLTTGTSDDFSAWSVRLPRALENSIVEPILQENAWGENILATRDFVRVITAENMKDGVGDFVRTPAWVALLTGRVENGRTKIKTMLLLSPFEVNELIPLFRSSKMKTRLHMFATKLRPSQNILLPKMELAVPSLPSAGISFGNLDIFYANLSLFAGGQYFTDEEEQQFFCRFFGYIIRPWSKSEEKVFNDEWTENGFIKPEYRKRMSAEHRLCKFQANPEDLIRKIIVMRYGFLSTHSHVSLVIAESKKHNFN